MVHFWAIIETNTAIHVPKHLKNILALNGYDDASSIQSITTKDIDLFEEFVRNEIDCFIGTNDDPKDFYGDMFYNKKDKFKIMKGDRVKLMDVVEYAKINFNSAGHHFSMKSKQISHLTSSNLLCSQELADDNLEDNQPIQTEYNLDETQLFVKSIFDVTANADDKDVIVTPIKDENEKENVDNSTKDREIEPQVQSLSCLIVNKEQANDTHVNLDGIRTITRAQSDIVVDKMKHTNELRNSKTTKNIEDKRKRTDDFTAATKLPIEGSRRISSRLIQSISSEKDLLTTVSSSSSNITFARLTFGSDGAQCNSTIAESAASLTDIPIVLYPGADDDRESTIDDKMLNDENSSVKRFCCDICGKKFRSKGNITKHMVMHTGVKPHACKVCKRSFSRLGDLRSHLKIHTGEKPFTCDVCAKAFSRLLNLSVHKRIHSGEKPFVCDVCPNAFSTSSHLSVHKRIHSGEKPFVCGVCSKAFNQSSTLSAHKRIHSGEKPFVCDVCPKTFNQSAHLSVHKIIHSGEKPFICDVCPNAYSTSSNLWRHKRLHSGEKFRCDVCPKSFNDSSNLSKHKKIHSGKVRM